MSVSVVDEIPDLSVEAFEKSLGSIAKPPPAVSSVPSEQNRLTVDNFFAANSTRGENSISGTVVDLVQSPGTDIAVIILLAQENIVLMTVTIVIGHFLF